MQHTDPVLKKCQEHQIAFLFDSISSLDVYFRIPKQNDYYLLTDANLVNLARVFEEIEYPGLPVIDASLRYQNKRYYFRCTDNLHAPPPLFFTAQNIYFDCEQDKFIDKFGAYRDLRSKNLVPRAGGSPTCTQVMDAAHLAARYNFTVSAARLTLAADDPAPSAYSQRRLLRSIMQSDSPNRGLEVLRESGFIALYWPEIHEMLSVLQTKDFHPEGNVWEHALACLEHRKETDLLLSLSLFLHDIGKTKAHGDRQRPFQNHSEFGADISYRFLKRLGFGQELIRDVVFLVRHHMMPAALHAMPLYRIQKLLRSPLFPHLLELYRADIESSFRKPDGYYEACRIYRSFLKIKNNPYRSFKLSKRILSQ
jgi:poly(A) polymerase